MIIPAFTIGYALLADLAIFLVPFVALLGAVRILFTSHAREVIAKLPFRNASRIFFTPPADFPALCRNIVDTYGTLRAQDIEGKALSACMELSRTAAGQLAGFATAKSDLVEGSKVESLLRSISDRFGKLGLALGKYHGEVELRYCKMMHDMDGALLHLRSSTHMSETLERQSAGTRKALDRTFCSMLETHRKSVTAIDGRRAQCWIVFHSLLEDIAALQCLVARTNPQLFPRFGKDILVNLWDTLGLQAGSLSPSDYQRVSMSLSLIIPERERMSRHILASKSVLDEAALCIDSLWDATRQANNREVAYFVHVENIVTGVKMLREAWDQKAAPDVEALDSLMPLPIGRDFKPQGRVDRKIASCGSSGAQALKRHYCIA